MSRSVFRRLAVLAIALSLALPLGAAASPDLAVRRAETFTPSLFGQLWDWLTGVWAEVGCSIDPGGQTCAAPQVDEGCSIDPSGRSCPTAQSQADVGCGIDPGGRTCPTPQVDEGCGIDPNGRTCSGVQ